VLNSHTVMTIQVHSWKRIGAFINLP